MPLIQPLIRERIMLYARPSSGKSFASFQIADLYQQTGTPGTIHILDTDFGDSALRTHISLFPNLTNLNIKPVADWEEMVKESSTLAKTVSPSDWIVVDLMCKTWDWVQDYFTDKVFQKDMGAYFLDKRIEMEKANKKGGSAFEGRKDWPVIKKLHAEWFRDLVTRCKCNILCCNSASAIASDDTEQMVTDLFSRIGLKPAGNKQTPHDVHTIAYLSVGKRSGYQIQVVKDRGREFLTGELTNFAVQYLVSTAGWRLS